jgi:hypothetical protein
MNKYLLLLLFFLPLTLCAQQHFEYNKYQAINVGIGLYNELMPEGYRYNATTILPTFSLWDRGYFSIYAEGQFTFAPLTEDVPTAYEFGANLGVRFQTRLAPQLVMVAGIGSGPHFITVDTRMQADGFIFSDNFELGLSYYLKQEYKTAVSFKGRFRHISNAGLMLPNWGIDNFFLVLGVRTNLRKK